MSAGNSQDDSDDELDDCPICVEPFDESDRMFLPCQCNYRVCMFCVRRLMTEFDGRCPGCRSVYNEANFRVREMDPDELEKRRQREKQRQQERMRQQQAKQQAQQQASQQQGVQTKNNQQQQTRPTNTTGGAKRTNHLSPLGGPQQSSLSSSGGQFSLDGESALAQQRKNLANVRVVQHHVVFVLGLPLAYAKEDILRRPEHFGQYGPIVKIVVGHPASAPGRTASASAHITFQKADDARDAIRGVDGVVVDGHQIRASFGTTRYCHAFLRGQQCSNPECLFLHQEVDPSAQTMAAKQTTGAPVVTTPAATAAATPAHMSTSTFGGTDPFALENVAPEQPVASLNGIDVAQYEKQRSNRNAPSTLTMGRAPGEGRPIVPPSSPATTTTAAGGALPAAANGGAVTSAPISYDCALSLVADLVISRPGMDQDLRRKLSFITGPRAKSTQFSGLECILASPAPLFIAPTVASQADVELSNTVGMIVSETTPSTQAGTPAAAAGGAGGDASSKDKKLTRKGKKAAFAAQNRIGGEDAY